jgi:hypothetical protein
MTKPPTRAELLKAIVEAPKGTHALDVLLAAFEVELKRANFDREYNAGPIFDWLRALRKVK